jgi:hypothetical protein
MPYRWIPLLSKGPGAVWHGWVCPGGWKIVVVLLKREERTQRQHPQNTTDADFHLPISKGHTKAHA